MRRDAHSHRWRLRAKILREIVNLVITQLRKKIERIESDQVHSVPDAVVVFATKLAVVIPALEIARQQHVHLEMHMRAIFRNRELVRASAHRADRLATLNAVAIFQSRSNRAEVRI